MSSAIERLRASKLAMVQRETTEGKQGGREWAETRASYEDLRRLAKVEVNNHEDDINQLLKAVNPNDEADRGECLDWCFGHLDVEPSEEYVRAFIEGAQDFFREVERKL